MSKNSQPAEGVIFPKNPQGERSTTDTSKQLFATCFRAVKQDAIAQEVLKESNWRYRYGKYYLKHVQVSLESPKNALAIANAGLNYLHDNFEFVRGDKTYKLSEAMKEIKGSFHTAFIKGNQPKPKGLELKVPYKDEILSGEKLVEQLNRWARYGTIEPNAAEAIAEVVRNPEWVDLSDRYFVLLGAGSAMGPYQILMSLGANVIAVDLDRENIWERLISIAKLSPGTLTFPLKKATKDFPPEDICKHAGSNLITQVPEINNWLQSLHPDKQLVVGCYVYLDGEAHVKVALSCDAIMKELSEKRKATLAFLCTPTDIHVIPDDARREANNNYGLNLANIPLLPIRLFGGNRYLVKNGLPQVTTQSGKKISYVDGIVVQQGPNYALAKRMQHWRAIVARAGGSRVSTHIAPSTATASVVHNRQFAWAYDGMPYFKPIEIFQQETSNAVMSAILIHDLNNPKAVANPSVPLENPLELFREASFHGGVWRAGYKVGSLGDVSVVIHFLKLLKPLLFLGLLFLIVVFYFKLKSMLP